MNAGSLITGNRATLKLLFVGALSLAMLIPLLMVRSITTERQQMQSSAYHTISNRWGGSQTISGLVAVTHSAVQQSGERVLELSKQWQANVLPELTISARMTTEYRYLGIYEMPVYTVLVNISGQIDWTVLNQLQPEGDLVFWLPLGDVRGVREVSPLMLGKLELPARPLNVPANDNTGLQFTLPASQRSRPPETYSLELKIAGFGMRLETPADAYQRNERSVKYGFLFISLTFFALFLFEVMTGRPLHPVPYMLTGAALAVFYLVLLALSEYLSFSRAFMVAASLLVLIVTPYTGVVLGGRRRGFLVGVMMSLTYGLLYALVSAEHLSLLLGAVTLLLAIAILMYLTRKVDWFRSPSGPKQCLSPDGLGDSI